MAPRQGTVIGLNKKDWTIVVRFDDSNSIEEHQWPNNTYITEHTKVELHSNGAVRTQEQPEDDLTQAERNNSEPEDEMPDLISSSEEDGYTFQHCRTFDESSEDSDLEASVAYIWLGADDNKRR